MRSIRNVNSEAAALVSQDRVFWGYRFRDSKDRIVAPVSVFGTRVADTHCHLDMLPHPDLAIARAGWHGTGLIVSVVDPTEDPAYTYQNLAAWKTAADALLTDWSLQNPDHADSDTDSEGILVNHLPGLPDIRTMIGCHPHNASKFDDLVQNELISRLGDQSTVALGEIGLDYHYDTSPRTVQRDVFRRQLAIAHQLGLPVSLHLREAHQDGLAILDKEGWPSAGVLLHCYTLGSDEMWAFLDHGAFLAFGGTITFKNADRLRQAVLAAPQDRIMTETDAPFMTPAPMRGTLCSPEHTLFNAACLCEIRGAETFEQIEALLVQIYDNVLRFFRLDSV
jgi:TatD DNase family protein